jgi:hypothetical protein
MAEVLAEVI